MNATRHDLPEPAFLTSGKVGEAERAAAGDAVREALAGTHERIRSVRVTLSLVDDPSLPRPALAQAIVETDGGRLRAQAAAPGLAEAIDLLRRRLSVRTAHLRAG
ncbi:hypothetical protein Acsp04_59310 [Actinomadura sp. NBRC 104425]|uniref:hypothetical protein n=1 Tax=Actinomadura sp. NBRC 104425 TaxID=3032204 RepID=UPI00249FB08A|nr:hypothetical protein [Actinomadura sp. NBRC 104425]GLZ15696.1 hypothetical protein Acsp04_59310 [Actinomadura sp. NBRC 104425]